MSQRPQRQFQPDPNEHIRAEEMARAERLLANHQSILQSLSDRQRREIASRDLPEDIGRFDR